MAKKFNLKKILAPVGDIVRKLKNRRGELMSEVEIIDRELSRFGGSRRGRRPNQAPATAKRRGKRKRRSREELDALAEEIFKFIGSKGKGGVTGKEIQAQFGPMVPSVNAWLKLYSPAKVKTTGAKSKMRYYA